MVQAEIWRLLGNKGDRVPFQVADGTAIALGDFLVLTDNMIVVAHTTNADVPIVGIAAAEKVANDGNLFITGITNCIFKAKVVSGGSATIGDFVSMSTTAGEVDLHTSLDYEKGWTVGRSYTDAASTHTSLFRSTF